MPEDEEIPRNRSVGIVLFIIFLFTIYAYKAYQAGAVLSIQAFWNGLIKDWIDTLIFILLVGPLFYLIYLVASYKGSKKSKLYGLLPLVERLPIIRKPQRHVRFREKLFWTGLILVLYFVMTNIYIYGLNTTNMVDVFSSFRAIMAGAEGSILDLGIGPIVTASIIMQLFVGAKLLNLDLGNEEDRSLYQGVQKLLVIIMIFVEAIPQVFGYLTPDSSFVSMLNGVWPGHGTFLADTFIVLQLFFGSYLLFMMDELVSKWGIGSGVSLFIAAGVSQALITGTINWIPGTPTQPVSVLNPPSGTIPRTYYLLTHFSAADLYNGRIETVLFGMPNGIVALIGTLIVFFLVAWTESTKIELPLAHERVRGARGRYPIKLLYASNIPVILTSALMANITMWSLIFWTNPALAHVPILGHDPWFGVYPNSTQAALYGIQTSTPIGGLAYYLSNINGLGQWLLPLMEPSTYSSAFLGHSELQFVIHVLAFTFFMIGMSVLFAKFWIETTNMNAESVAKQILSSGMQIPGFRREPKVIESVLNKYIPPITTFSGAAVGALAAFAGLIGTVGNTTGTGVLLTVGIVIQFYEAMGREQLMEMHPVIRQFFEG
ncbi:MAG: preprotein translocase subunit SecY [Thermoplasmata archaeon]|nr:preprotein translocase subunit SecY [Thermoplasmata archaeon]